MGLLANFETGWASAGKDRVKEEQWEENDKIGSNSSSSSKVSGAAGHGKNSYSLTNSKQVKQK